MVTRLLLYLNPIAHLGDTRYSYLFPLVTTFSLCIILEIYVNVILRNPASVGLYAIFIFIALIIYFAFREGIRGGVISTVITIGYYFYLIYHLHYKDAKFTSGVETTIILGLLYFLLALIIGWLKQTIDILIEKEADERKRLETIIQQLPVGVIITNSKGEITQQNRQVEAILGMKFPKNYIVGNASPLQATENGKPVNPARSPLLQAIHQHKSTADREYTVVRPDKKTVHVQVSAAPIRNRRHKVIAAAQIISDITQQKELEARKDDFVNMASHELKTPITSMKLYVDSLMMRLEKGKDEKALRTVTNIKSQTERLQDLVNDLLDVSRLQTGKLSFQKENFAIDELIREAVDDLQASTAQSILFSSKGSVNVYADRFRVYQVLTNLITNAMKYAPRSTKIIIKLKKENDMAIVSVQDFGIGIAKDQHRKIFDRLYQVNDATEKTFPGFGMGLYISKAIIQRHKGRIWVESEKGKGATFYFTLPLQKTYKKRV